jgi:hypothetical protein
MKKLEWQKWHEPTQEEIELNKIELQKEYEGGLECCLSCDNFIYFMAEAGFCKIVECNCICKNPKAMIDIWDKKCDKWIKSPSYLSAEEYELSLSE